MNNRWKVLQSATKQSTFRERCRSYCKNSAYKCRTIQKISNEFCILICVIKKNPSRIRSCYLISVKNSCIFSEIIGCRESDALIKSDTVFYLQLWGSLWRMRSDLSHRVVFFFHFFGHSHLNWVLKTYGATRAGATTTKSFQNNYQVYPWYDWCFLFVQNNTLMDTRIHFSTFLRLSVFAIIKH